MSTKGITCPACKGERLYVYRIHRPCPGRIVRYRHCRRCGRRVITEERVRLPRACAV